MHYSVFGLILSAAAPVLPAAPPKGDDVAVASPRQTQRAWDPAKDRVTAPNRGFLNDPPTDPGMPFGAGYSAVGDDGRRYVQILKLRGRTPLPDGKSVGYYATYKRMPKRTVVPIGNRLWQVWEAARGGVLLVRPGYDWQPQRDKPFEWVRDLPAPPRDKFFVPANGSNRILGGQMNLKKLISPKAEEGTPSRPEATLWIAPPQRDGKRLPVTTRTVRVGDQIKYAEGPPITLTVTRIVPSDPKLKLIGWVEMTDEPEPADPPPADEPGSDRKK